MSKDTKTLNLDFSEGELDKLRTTLRRMGEFVACFEEATEKMIAWQENVEQTMQTHQQIIDKQVQKIQSVVEKIDDLMTETGMLRMNKALAKTAEQGKEQLKSLETISQKHLDALAANNQKFQDLAKKTFERIDRASVYLIRNISTALNSFRLSDFQRLTNQCREIVEETSKSAIDRLKRITQWFHWKNLAMVFVVTLFVSLTIALYINDEMPWETHNQVVAQRHAGEALINAWGTLSQAEQTHIKEGSKKALI